MNTIAISQIGGTIAGSGANNTGVPSGAGAVPGNVSAITVSGYIDPVALQIHLTITYTPPSDSGDTFNGVHLWLDIPDHGASGSTYTVGAAGGAGQIGNNPVGGPFNPIDLGVQTNPAQPWQVVTAFPTYLSLDPTKNIAARIYISSVSTITDNPIIQDGLANATPNQAFTLVSLASGTSTAGTNVAPNCGTITVQVLPNDNSTGKLMTPFLALMGSVPSNPPTGWGYRLYISYGTADPTNPANLTPITDVQTAAGVVPASKTDAVTDVINSFSLQTPVEPTQAFIWAISGLTDSSGTFTPNNVVVGITNSCPVTFGTGGGTINAAQVMASSISAEMQVYLGQLGLTPSSIGAGFLAAGAAQTNLGVVSASTILAANSIVGSLLATTGIITSSAQIGTGIIAAANIGSCNVSSLLAGTATFTSTAVFQSSSGPSVTISASGLTLASSSNSLSITSSAVTLSSSAGSLSLTSSGLSLTAGSNSLTITSSNILLTNIGNSTTTSLTNATVGGYYAGLSVAYGSYTSYASAQGFYSVLGSSATAFIGCNSTTGIVEVTVGNNNLSLAFDGSNNPLLVMYESGSLKTELTINSLTLGGSTVINSSLQWVGAGVVCNNYGIQGAGFNAYYSGNVYDGQTSIGGGLSATGGGYGICGQVYVGGTWYQVLWGTEQGVNESHDYVAMVGGIYAGFYS